MPSEKASLPPAVAAADQWMVRDIERALKDAQLLHTWWRGKQESRAWAKRFDLLHRLPPGDRAEGFFDETEISSGKIRLLGLTHEMAFDRPKAGPPEAQRAQIREFVLRYLLRIADYATPLPSTSLGFTPAANTTPPRHGFGYSQLYARQTAGPVEAFAAGRQAAIADLRDLGPIYEWLILKARPYDYEMELRPLGTAGPSVTIPLPDSPVIGIGKPLVFDEERPAPGVLGRYGFAYALLNDPTPRGAQVYGPAQLRAGFQLIEFFVLESGETRVRLAFAGNRPEQVLQVPFEPLGMALSLAGLVPVEFARRAMEPLDRLRRVFPLGPAFDPVMDSLRLADLATAGIASRSFNISVEQLERDILAAHFNLYHGLITGALLSYRQVPDWLDAAKLPDWAKSGEAQQRGGPKQ